MKSKIEYAPAERTQRIYARLAGSLFLALIIIALGGSLILPHIAEGATFAETAKTIAASERAYRVFLLLRMIDPPLGGILLAFALYVTLKPVNSFLAQLAMIFHVADSLLACLIWICIFLRLHIYTSSPSGEAFGVSAQGLVDLTRRIEDATENVGGIFFGIAMLLFFYLFFASRYIPRIVSVLGVSASAIWIGLYFSNVVFPEYHAVFQYISWPPMFIVDVATGLWLMVLAVKTTRPAQLPAIPG